MALIKEPFTEVMERFRIRFERVRPLLSEQAERAYEESLERLRGYGNKHELDQAYARFWLEQALANLDNTERSVLDPRIERVLEQEAARWLALQESRARLPWLLKGTAYGAASALAITVSELQAAFIEEKIVELLSTEQSERQEVSHE